MKRLIKILTVLAIVCSIAHSADAAVRVRGYFRSNGTYVQPHYRSNPDGNFYNNWSTYPNINPYTGARGTKRTPSYSGGTASIMPRYNSSKPSYWTNYSSPLISSSSPSYSTFGSSLSGGSSSSRGSSLSSGFSSGSSPFGTGSSILGTGSSPLGCR